MQFESGNYRIATIHDFLMNNYKEDVNFKKLADLVSMAKGSLCRFFKSNTGLTIFEYLNKIKTDFACKLLMDNDLSISDICFDSGFSNLSHFNKQFREITGVSPSVCRKRFVGLKLTIAFFHILMLITCLP